VGTKLRCNLCGLSRATSRGSLPEGQYRCRECRSSMGQPRAIAGRPRVRHRTGKLGVWATCGHCSREFVSISRAGGWSVFCSLSCAQRSKSRGNKRPYYRRASGAPGLSGHRRRDLLARWRRQSRVCIYCAGPCETVDHVVPLQQGGTNYEGNLVPCCRRCNGSKGARLLAVWRFTARGESDASAPV
jgi:5-methylcytosine-specific restriction endonuclease McrA